MRRISKLASVIGIAFIALFVAIPINSSASTSTFANYVCGPTQMVLFDNSNGGLVANGGTPPTFSTNGKAYCLNGIETYHWNDGKGSKPGYLWLKRLSGPAGLPDRTSFFQALGSPGQNNVANANSYVYPPMKPPIIIDGTYQCVDTIRGTWSQDAASGGNGFCHITVMAAMPASAIAGAPAQTNSVTTPAKSAPAPTNKSSSAPIFIGAAAVLVVGIGAALVLMKGGVGSRIAKKPPVPKPVDEETVGYESGDGLFPHDQYKGDAVTRNAQAWGRLSPSAPDPEFLKDSPVNFKDPDEIHVKENDSDDLHLTTGSPVDELPDISGWSEPTDGEVM